MKLPKSPGSRDGLVFLKLGGSLITDKHTPRTARGDQIQRICQEIFLSLDKNPGIRLVLGHGSGSFGHFSGKKYNTREGVSTPEDWLGFAEVWHDARTLNHLVMENLQEAGLPAIAFPPSASVTTNQRVITSWDITAIETSLYQGLVPVVYGDVVFDSELGGTILSTEDLFLHLARRLDPEMILLAGQDQGVWEDFPDCTKLIPSITPSNYPQLLEKISSSTAPDVTGGMGAKVNQMLRLAEENPGLRIEIFSGKEPGNISQALSGMRLGTSINR